MRYCVNCRTPFEQLSAICPACTSDQTTPDELIDVGLRVAAQMHRRNAAPSFGYPGERAALALAVVISVAIMIVAGTVSFGLFFLILGLNLAYLVLDHWRNPRVMIRVSESSFKRVHRLAKVAAYRLGIPLPPVFIHESPEYNAYTKGFHRYGFIVVHSSLTRDFRPLELLFVLGHEMGHIKHGHTTWLNLINPAQVSGAKFVFAPAMQVIFNVWSVKSEYTADQAGLIACRDAQAAVMTMLKLAGGADVEKEVDPGDILKSKEVEPGLGSSLLEYLGDHPFAENRVRQLIGFARTEMFRSAIAPNNLSGHSTPTHERRG